MSFGQFISSFLGCYIEEICRFASGLTKEPAARLPYLALTRDNFRRCEAAR
jgi:hypothetical protein